MIKSNYGDFSTYQVLRSFYLIRELLDLDYLEPGRIEHFTYYEDETYFYYQLLIELLDHNSIDVGHITFREVDDSANMWGMIYYELHLKGLFERVAPIIHDDQENPRHNQFIRILDEEVSYGIDALDLELSNKGLIIKLASFVENYAYPNLMPIDSSGSFLQGLVKLGLLLKDYEKDLS